MTDQPQTDLPDATSAAHLAEMIATGEELLIAATQTLSTLLREVRDGQTSRIKSLTPAHSELSKALRQAVDTQRSYDDWRKRTSGGLAEGEIDLGWARDKVGGQLDRLRAAMRSGEVPGGDDAP